MAHEEASMAILRKGMSQALPPASLPRLDDGVILSSFSQWRRCVVSRCNATIGVASELSMKSSWRKNVAQCDWNHTARRRGSISLANASKLEVREIVRMGQDAELVLVPASNEGRGKTDLAALCLHRSSFAPISEEACDGFSTEATAPC